jgi:hypothetical protein
MENYGKYIVERITRIEKKQRHKKFYWIRFLETGFEYEADRSCVRQNLVKDYYKPKVYGVGFLGDMFGQTDKKIISLWRGLLGRCYSPTNASFKNYGAKGITVCERWLNYTNFHNDIVDIIGYDEDKFYSGELQLDKDIRQKEVANKTYSLDTCMFVSRSRNIEENSSTRSFKAISPEGKFFEGRNVKKFCEENGLQCGQVYSLLNKGGHFRHKGWTFGDASESFESLLKKYEHGLKKFFALNLKTLEIVRVVGAKNFAKQYNLSEGNISMCLDRKRNSHNGWKFFLDENEATECRDSINM